MTGAHSSFISIVSLGFLAHIFYEVKLLVSPATHPPNLEDQELLHLVSTLQTVWHG
jgi:hypothetical protein